MARPKKFNLSDELAKQLKSLSTDELNEVIKACEYYKTLNKEADIAMVESQIATLQAKLMVLKG